MTPGTVEYDRDATDSALVVNPVDILCSYSRVSDSIHLSVHYNKGYFLSIHPVSAPPGQGYASFLGAAHVRSYAAYFVVLIPCFVAYSG